jgi:hypothetical protein
LTNTEESERVRKTDNRFYQDLNRGHTDVVPFENNFIGKEKSIKTQPLEVYKQQVYMDMSLYAAKTVRIPAIEWLRSKYYQPARFSNNNIYR